MGGLQPTHQRPVYQLTLFGTFGTAGTHWYSWYTFGTAGLEGDWAGPPSVQAPPRCTKCTPNGQCTNHRIAGFNVPIKELKSL